MSKTGSLLIIAALATSCIDDVDNENFRRSESEVIIENLELAGFPRSEIGVLPDGTVFVGDDAVVTLQASREMIGHVDNLDGGQDEDFRQYHTSNLINTNIVQKICIVETSAFSNANGLSQALQNAANNYNGQGLQFSMAIGNGGDCDATITAYYDGNSGGGVAGFPSGGYPYSQLTVGPLVDDYGMSVATHVITHELGHTVGFRHTDYFNRSISCGGFAQNEGDAGVGATHIPGTPTTNVSSTTSVMNACFSMSSTGQWTSSDELALAYLYQGQGPAPWELVEARPDLSGGELSFEYDASTYDEIQFTMSGGSGDADLYVRFGAAPTAEAYDCRPYLGGNTEVCTFSPSQSGTYYVMIKDYQAYSGLTLTVERKGGVAPDPDPQPDPDPDPQPEPEVCDDGEDNDLDGATDCDDNDCSDDLVCQPAPEPGDWQELFVEDFEGNLGVFNDGGSDARWLSNANYAYGGSGSAEIRDNSGTKSSVYSDSFDLSGYAELEIEFFFYARSMENNEDFYVELYDGGSWVSLANFARGTDFDNNGFYTATIPVDSGAVNFSSQAQVRFRNDASGNSDWIYIDDVTVRAR